MYLEADTEDIRNGSTERADDLKMMKSMVRPYFDIVIQGMRPIFIGFVVQMPKHFSLFIIKISPWVLISTCPFTIYH